ncbi:MAG: hypothetical protein VXU42_04815, partial [Verrucomicrobiota bacterium]|nr:hypothetical protein [Verrucomicrobiota bacterium]
ITHGRAADTQEIDTHYRVKGCRMWDATKSTRAIRLIIATFKHFLAWALSKQPTQALGLEKISI